MDELAHGLAQALRLILAGDSTLIDIVFLSLSVTGFALLISTACGVPIGVARWACRTPASMD